MSIASFSEFVKKVTTERSTPNAENPLAAQLNFDQSLKGQAKLDDIAQKLAEVGKSQGYDFTADDVKKNMESLAAQYDINPAIAAMMDSYCTTTCHMGSTIGKD
jgi:hypothetical protein